ncbi:hypothetical protein QWY84_05950 [Aquisalimonas lutea]|uniref:helix-turn-helix domain-containing protein n=1 Tax=Aquisalimonas lutea TaxID=1327750 RepID=UPI0025B5C98E|nr:helix-turn-helix domain-containing protein [Aquisalimonas lutea]MDN3517148.1 hypothetical protein [Aquisalimonas lutea]
MPGKKRRKEREEKVESESSSQEITIRNRIKFAVDQFKTRSKAATAADVSTDMLYRYMRGDSPPGFQAIAGLAKNSGVSLDWIAFGKGPVFVGRHAEAVKVQESFERYRQTIGAGHPETTVKQRFIADYNQGELTVDQVSGVDSLTLETLDRYLRLAKEPETPGDAYVESEQQGARSALDVDLLESVIVSVRETLEARQVKLEAAKEARLVKTAYDYALSHNKTPTPETVLQLFIELILEQ